MNGAKSFSFKKLALVAGAFCAALGLGSSPVSAETGSAEAVIVTPLSFVKVDDLHMGQMMTSNRRGFVTLAPDGTRTSTNGIVLVGSAHQPAQFAGFGVLGQNVAISGTTRIWLTGPGQRMRLDRFTIGSTPTARLTTNPQIFFIGGSTGTFQFPVGARLRVNADQASGVYTGTWNITLNYQ